MFVTGIDIKSDAIMCNAIEKKDCLFTCVKRKSIVEQPMVNSG